MALSTGWSLDPNKWNLIRKEAGSNKWRFLPLVKANRELIPAKPGVYVICARASDVESHKLLFNLKNSVYVGQSDSLKRRFKEHLDGYGRVKAAKECFVKLEFWWVVIDEGPLSKKEVKNRLSFYEKLIQEALGPSANQVAAPHSITLKLKAPVYPNEAKKEMSQ